MKLWSLFNKQTREQFDGLTQFEIGSKIKINQKNELENYFVWSDHLVNWQNITEAPEFKELIAPSTITPKTPPPPPPPPPKIETEESSKNKPTSKLSIVSNSQLSKKKNEPDDDIKNPINLKKFNSSKTKQIEFPELRKHQRYPIKLKVLFRSQDVTFRTFTTNVSLGGVALQHGIPPHLMNKQCQLILTSPNSKENIKLDVMILHNGIISRLKFINGEKSIERLTKWLEKYIRINSKKQKSA